MNAKLSNRGNIALTFALILFVGVIILGFAWNFTHGTGIDTDAVLTGLNHATQATCNAIESACK